MKYLVFLCLLLNTCTRTPWPRPVSMGSVATICAPAREIWCEAGDPQCVQLKAAVAEVNAVVPGLFVWKGETGRDVIVHKLNTENITAMVRGVGVPDAFQALPIAMTILRPEPSQACLPGVPIVLIWPSKGLDTVAWLQVVEHELLHSLGADHAGSDCPYGTVMRRSINDERRVGLGKSDRNWLRAVYGR